MVVRSPTAFVLAQNGCWSSLGSQLRRAFPFICSLCCSLNDRRRAAHSFFKIGCLSSLFCISLARLHLIFLLLLMGGNVHPDHDPIFPSSVCPKNVTWRGKSVQCCTCSKWVHLRYSLLSFSKFRTLGSSYSWSCPPSASLLIILRLPPRTPPTCIPPLCNLVPSLLMLHSRPTLVFNPLILLLPILYLLPMPPHHRPLLPAVFLRLLLSLPALTPSGFSNKMLAIFEPGALNYFAFFCPIPLALSVSRNTILTHLLLFGFLDSLLCVLIAPTPGLAFSLVMPRTLAAASSFSSGRAYLSLNFLPRLSLCLIPTLIM